MKYIIGSILAIVGVVLGVYVGLWLCLIGGFVGLASAVGMMFAGLSFPSTLIAFSILKILVSAIAGWLSATVFFIPAFMIITKK